MSKNLDLSPILLSTRALRGIWRNLFSLTSHKISDRARERVRGCKLDELTTRQLRIGAGVRFAASLGWTLIALLKVRER